MLPSIMTAFEQAHMKLVDVKTKDILAMLASGNPAVVVDISLQAEMNGNLCWRSRENC